MELMVPPQNLEAERAVLAACLIDERATPRVCGLVQVEDFYREAHRLIFKAIRELADKGKPVDWGILTNLLHDKGEIEVVGGQDYLIELANAVPSTANVVHYCEIMTDKAELRRIIADITEILNKTGGDASLSDIREDLQQAAFRSASTARAANQDGLTHVRPIIKSVIQQLEHQGHGGGIPTGLQGLDEIIFRGFQVGEFVIIMGRPQHGKTALAINNLAVKASEQTAVAVFSLEMSKERLVSRLVGSRARVNMRSLQNGAAVRNQREWDEIMKASGPVSDLSIYIDDFPKVTVSRMRMKVKEASVRLDLDFGLIIVDYIQLMETEGKFQSDNSRVSAISRGLKLLAKELNCVVVGLSQLNRDVERRPFLIKGLHGRRPQLADLRDSGSLEQDSDVVIGVYRAEVYPEARNDDGIIDEKYKGRAELQVLKQREGPTGIAKLGWKPEFTTFYDLNDTPNEREIHNPRPFQEPRESEELEF